MSASEAEIGRLTALCLERGMGQDLNSRALRTLIAAEIEAVEAAYGPKANIETVMPDAHTDVISTLRRISTLTSVSERRRLTDSGVAATLTANVDYRLLDDTRLLRLGAIWGEQCIIAYDARLDQHLRDRVVLDLIRLSLAFSPVSRKTVGPLEIVNADHAQQRQVLLDQITDGRILAL
jgi:hypothetical protein